MNIEGSMGIDKINGDLAPQIAKNNDKKADDVNFKDVLKDLVNQVDTLQKDADASIQGLVTGETTNIHEVPIKMEEAGVAFDLMMAVRNKLVDAYKEIIKINP
jgi:flagellar hook-basal body complex protein FliE